MFPDTLRRLRKEKGLSQKQLAEIINVSSSAISQYERGKASPARENLHKLAEYFNVTVAYLEGTSSIEELENLLNSVFRQDVSVREYLTRSLSLVPENKDFLLSTLLLLEKAQAKSEV